MIEGIIEISNGNNQKGALLISRGVVGIVTIAASNATGNMITAKDIQILLPGVAEFISDKIFDTVSGYGKDAIITK